MSGANILTVAIVVFFVYLFVTKLVPALLLLAINLLFIYLAGRQALKRWQSNTHYWYEMGIIFSCLIVVFYNHLTPLWFITEFIVLAVLIAEGIQELERRR